MWLKRAAVLSRQHRVPIIAASVMMSGLALVPAVTQAAAAEGGNATLGQPACGQGSAPPPSPTGDFPPLEFGTEAASASPTGTITGPPDDPAKVTAALNELQGGSQPFLVRTFVLFNPPGSTNLPDVARYARQYAEHGRRLDVVLTDNYPNASLASWLHFVSQKTAEYAPFAGTIQVGNEADIGFLVPTPLDFITQGVLAVRNELGRLGVRDVLVGFNAAGFPNDPSFFQQLGQLGGPSFASAVNYVGIDVYPGVFPIPNYWPVTNGDYRQVFADILSTARLCWLPSAGIPASTPIHVSENGWPTSSTRPYSEQAMVLGTIIQAVSDYRATYNVTAYEEFLLRDANSAVDNEDYQFGIMQSDYTPKPAFYVYQSLIAQLG